MTGGKSGARRMKESQKQLPSNGDALKQGMEAGYRGDLTNPTFSSLEDRMNYRAGWMEARKQTLSDKNDIDD
jgi:hypothetical protein